MNIEWQWDNYADAIRPTCRKWALLFWFLNFLVMSRLMGTTWGGDVKWEDFG